MAVWNRGKVHVLEDVLYWFSFVAELLQVLDGVEHKRERRLASFRHERDDLLEGVGLPARAQIGERFQSWVLRRRVLSLVNGVELGKRYGLVLLHLI